MGQNTVEPDGPKMTISYGARAQHTGSLGLETHSKYAILAAFPRQRCFRERAAVLLLYIHFLHC